MVYCDSGYLIRSSIHSWKERFKLKTELLEGFLDVLVKKDLHFYNRSPGLLFREV